jgi:hypothetical protein
MDLPNEKGRLGVMPGHPRWGARGSNPEPTD